jgi:ATP-binding cassette, subfamily C, bacterial exporter for protease/lipase
MEPDSDTVSAVSSPMQQSVAALQPLFWRVVGFSAIVNIMALALSLYLMQIFDRVFASQSLDTLFFLTLAVVLALGLSALLDLVRLHIVSRSGSIFAAKLGPLLLSRILTQRDGASAMRMDVLHDLSTVRSFISTPTLFSILDIIWVPFYLLIVALLSIWLAVVAVIGVAVLLGLAVLNDRRTRPLFLQSQAASSHNMRHGERLIRNADIVGAMGMAHTMVERWRDHFYCEMSQTNKGQEAAAWILSGSRFVRQIIQVILLCTGAVLVLKLQLTAGAMFATTLLISRLLAPLEASIGQWRQVVLARQSYDRLTAFLHQSDEKKPQVTFGKPVGKLTVESLAYQVPGQKTPLFQGVRCALEPGEVLAIIGPSASGKTTLARLIIGMLQPASGHVRLDDADVYDWDRDAFGQYVGYLAQDVELFPGTVGDNIARFQEASSEQIIAAAQLAGCHELILHLPGTYDMQIGEHGQALSGGQRQRIGLARALFNDPKLVVLDEPNANLDTLGEAALIQTIARLKARKCTVVLVAHRASLLKSADKILLLNGGRMQKYGDAADIYAELIGDSAGANRSKTIIDAKSVTQIEAIGL